MTRLHRLHCEPDRSVQSPVALHPTVKWHNASSVKQALLTGRLTRSSAGDTMRGLAARLCAEGAISAHCAARRSRGARVRGARGASISGCQVRLPGRRIQGRLGREGNQLRSGECAQTNRSWSHWVEACGAGYRLTEVSRVVKGQLLSETQTPPRSGSSPDPPCSELVCSS